MDIYRITIDLPLPDETFPRAKALVSIEGALDKATAAFEGMEASICGATVPEQPAEPVPPVRKPRRTKAQMPDEQQARNAANGVGTAGDAASGPGSVAETVAHGRRTKAAAAGDTP